MMNSMKMGTYIYITEDGEKNYNFNFSTNLSISDKQKFVNSVVELVVDDLKRKYNSILRDLIFDFYIIDFLTDIDTDEFKKSSSFVDDVEEFLLSTNIVDIVKENAFPTLFDELNKAIDKSIEYITGIHPNPLNEALASLISTIENKINEVDLNSMMCMASKLAGMTDGLTIDNLVDAYMNSDVHKKNLIEIEEVKKQRAEIAKNLDKAIEDVNNENVIE